MLREQPWPDPAPLVASILGAPILPLPEPLAWPSLRPRCGSQPRQFCGLQISHTRDQSRRQPTAPGHRLGEGTRHLLVSSGCRQARHQGLKHHKCVLVKPVPRPLPPVLPDVFLGGTPLLTSTAECVFPGRPAQPWSLTTVGRISIDSEECILGLCVWVSPVHQNKPKL